MWHEFDATAMTADLRDVAAFGLATVRALLAWDAFMPTRAGVPARQLRNFETFLDAASGAGLRVVPVLFAQSLGDCIMLPAYAIDVDAPRAGVRAVSDGVVQPGGPRDLYTDPAMLDAEMTWLDTMLTAFAGHEAIAAWDLGHDPATTVRPRRIDHLRGWVALMSERVHAGDQRCVLTFGARDALTARGVRPGTVSPLLDACRLDVGPAPLRGETGSSPAVFVVQLAQRLLGDVPLLAEVATAAPAGAESAAEPEHRPAPSLVGETVARLAEVGCAGVHADAWAACDARVLAAPPFDREPWRAGSGLVTADGSPTAAGAAWRAHRDTELEQQAAQPWPAGLDVEDYYRNLPQSASDLYAAWQAGRSDDPAMLN